MQQSVHPQNQSARNISCRRPRSVQSPDCVVLKQGACLAKSRNRTEELKIQTTIRLFFLSLLRENFRKMIHNTDKRHVGDAPAMAGRTFGNCCKAGALLPARRSLETAPSGVFVAQSPYPGRQNVANSRNIMRHLH
jgi:hypothetical protein